uniref:Ribosomal RNA methyltransferase FtsJ domain-containing protein n=1 Tax=Chaetoceros debilis TaxID=122233 RepID=A0A7S3QJM1_9STRA
MVASLLSFVMVYLLASSKFSRKGGGMKGVSSDGRKGRKRYSSDGSKRKTSQKKAPVEFQQDVSPLPTLTRPGDPKLYYFTCRHTYEDTLIDEINRYTNRKVSAFSPYPGLVRVEDEDDILPHHYDPVYALQSIPDCVVVSGESISLIAKSIFNTIFDEKDSVDGNDSENDTRNFSELQKRLRSAPRGSLSIHSIVPGMCKGQKNPAMQNRSQKVAESLLTKIKKIFPAARRPQDGEIPSERWVLQIMLNSPEIAVASLTRCERIGPGYSYWPNIHHTLGLANVDIVEKMPSSAYRKLMEAIECMRVRPSESAIAFDLGACPGGWTTVMRRLGCSVVAVDRSKVDPVLMKDEMVNFVKGDAFAFEPNVEDICDERWMVSDVIAYPDRCTFLIDTWCK